MSKTSDVSALLSGLRETDPAKITSVISRPRRLRTDCSPRTHLMASTTFDFPEPFGPTTTVMPSGNSKRVRSAKLLKPNSSSALSRVMTRCRRGPPRQRRLPPGPGRAGRCRHHRDQLLPRPARRPPRHRSHDRGPTPRRGSRSGRRIRSAPRRRQDGSRGSGRRWPAGETGRRRGRCRRPG